jgi:hypothetical protein
VKREEATSPSTPVRVKKEPASPPPTRGRSSGALVIRDQPSQPGRKRKAAKKEDAAAAAANRLAEEEAKRAEDAAVAEAIARSLNDLVPADNTLPEDAALAWSRRARRSNRRPRRSNRWLWKKSLYGLRGQRNSTSSWSIDTFPSRGRSPDPIRV